MKALAGILGAIGVGLLVIDWLYMTSVQQKQAGNEMNGCGLVILFFIAVCVLTLFKVYG